jgi:hypothetical protein
MTMPIATQRMTRPLLTIAAILVSLAYAIWGAERAVAAAVGAGVGLANWFALRWLMQRLVASGATQRGGVALLLVGKIGLLMAVVFVLISRLALDPVGIAFGLSVLFLGPVVAGLLSATTAPIQSLDPSAASAAREER